MACQGIMNRIGFKGQTNIRTMPLRQFLENKYHGKNDEDTFSAMMEAQYNAYY